MEKTCVDREERLRRLILTEIEESGPISFAQFMKLCLYHPEYGYYPSGGAKIGRDGDYYTGPCVNPFLGHMIAKQLFQMGEVLGGERFDVLEMGGGMGFLCEDILDWLKRNKPSFCHRLRYFLLETAPHFLKQQKERLFNQEREGLADWICPEEFRNGKVEIEGCLLSNELVDAFPVHRVVFDHGNLKEIYVSWRDNKFEEQLGELSDPRISEYFRSMKIVLQEGQKAEVNLEALDWIDRVGRSLKKGFVLTIDYGYLSKELYAPHRREGTLLCYFQHRISENPYKRIGAQDITSHVNFSSLIRKGEEVGLRLTGFVPQYRFLIGLGLLQEMEALGKKGSEIDGLKLRLSMKQLIEPEAGMGEMFKVLIQHKGVEVPALDGLRELHSISWVNSEKGVL